ncbi:MAG: GTP-binding protein, partial [Chroococcidiopsis sp.]
SDHLENDGFTSISFQSDKPLAIRKFQYFLDNQLPENIFRAKGIMWFDESPKRHIFHLCGKRFTLEDEEWNGKPKKNQLVLIGQNLDREALLQQLQSCICLPSTSRGKGFGKG